MWTGHAWHARADGDGGCMRGTAGLGRVLNLYYGRVENGVRQSRGVYETGVELRVMGMGQCLFNYQGHRTVPDDGRLSG